tara:strand:- start:924 stop:2162 length:1239 start_codon:yes stop_codon:yes gene_type:complete
MQSLKGKKRFLAAVCMGSSLQWYDFALFGAFAPIMAKTFFPNDMYAKSLLFSFIVFYLSFILMPVGGFLFGWLGDRFGRKKALSLSILFMTIPTVLIGITPGFVLIGYYSTVIIIICRMLQGFVASPEFSNAAVYLVEIAPNKLRSVFGCLAGSSYSIGFTIGGFIGSFLLAFPDTQLWRLAFLFAGLGAVFVYYFRKKLPESPFFNISKQKFSLKSLTDCKQPFVCNFFLGSLQAALAYGCYVWMVSFLHVWGGVSLSAALLMVTFATLLDACLEPFIAFIADRTSKKAVSSLGMLLFIIFSFKLFSMAQAGTIAEKQVAVLLISLLIAIICCPLNALCAMSFPCKIRCLGFSLSFNLGVAIFGGITPVILTIIFSYYKSIGLISLYLIIFNLLGLLSLFFIKDISENIED